MRNLLLAVGLVVLGVVLTIGAQTLLGRGARDAATVEGFDDWRLECPAPSVTERGCELGQVVIDQRSKVSLVRLVIHMGSEPPTMTVAVPHGVLLEPGIGLVFGEQAPKMFAYRTCDTNACKADVALDSELENNLRNNEGGKVTVTDRNGKPFVIPFSLKGFTRGLDTAYDEASVRNSWWRQILSSAGGLIATAHASE